MTTTTTGAEFRTLIIPESLDADDAGDFHEMMRVRNLVYREISGHDDHALTAAELLPHYRPDEYEIRHMWIVVVEGRVVGRAGVDVPLEDGSTTAFWQIELLREVWGRGIGSEALGLIESTARSHGRTVLQSYAEHPAADGESIAAPTGFGRIPHDHAARFYLRHGYRLEQVERCSALDLHAPIGTLTTLLENAKAASEGYRVVQWTAPTPSEWVDGYAWMKSRMSTDAPSADMEFDEEAWDAARIARSDSLHVDGGRTLLVTAAQHISSGELCAFNELTIGPERTAASSQEDTLVLKEHRGHRLGLLVKAAGLLTWRTEVPESPRIITYNAEENRPMLDINEALGFAPIAYEGGWKKILG